MANETNRVLYCRAEIDPENDLQLSGIVVRYGDVAKLPFGKEVIDQGAFTNVETADVILNRQHNRGMPLARSGGGGLEISDSSAELRLRATLPDTDSAREAITLVKSGVLRGFSTEFRAVSEYTKDRVLHVEKAQLVGIALVDRPAYPASQVDRHRAISDPIDDPTEPFDWRSMVQRGAL